MKRGKAVHFADVDLNEDEDQVEKGQDEEDDNDEEEEEEMDDDEGEFISLVDVLDGKGNADMDDDGSAALKRSFTKETTLAHEVVANDRDSHEEGEGAEESSSGEEEKKRKGHQDATTSTSQEPKRKKRQIIKERTEAGTENEFRAQASGTILTTLICVF